MKPSAWPPVLLAALALALGALTACTAPAAAPAEEKPNAQTSSERTAPTAGAPDSLVGPDPDYPGCSGVATGNVAAYPGGYEWIERKGKPVDRGPHDGARGDVIVGDVEVSAYIVAEGDTIDQIAKRLCTGSVFIIARNGLDDGNMIHPGDRLELTAVPAPPGAKCDGGVSWGATGEVTVEAGVPTAYTVAEGDNRYSVNKRFCLLEDPDLLGEGDPTPGETLQLQP